MAVEVVKAMVKDPARLTQRQIFFETHASTIIGFETISDKLIGINKVQSVNGKSGVVQLTTADLKIDLVSSQQPGLMSSELYQQVQGILGASFNNSNRITLEKVES